MWYVIQVRTGKEEEIQLQCEKVIREEVLERCFIPRYEQMKRYQGKWHKEEKNPVSRLCFSGQRG